MSIGVTEVLIALPLLVVMAAVVAVIGWVVVRAARRPGARPPDPGSPAAHGAGRWNVQVRRAGRADVFTGFGTVTVSAGVVAFTPQGAATPVWAEPANSFGVRGEPLLAAADVTLDSRQTGRLSLTLSPGGLLADTGNTVAALAERSAADEFVQAMRASGAAALG